MRGVILKCHSRRVALFTGPDASSKLEGIRVRLIDAIAVGARRVWMVAVGTSQGFCMGAVFPRRSCGDVTFNMLIASVDGGR